MKKTIKKVIIAAAVVFIPASALAAQPDAADHADHATNDNGGPPDRCLLPFPHNPLASQYWNCNVGFTD